MEIIKNEYGTYFYYPCTNVDKKGTIIFIHGFATTSEYHDSFIKYINDEYDYIAIQLPGAGYQKWNGNKKPTVDDMVFYCVELIRTMEIDKFYLIGHSMGGGIAPRVANILESQIKAVVVVTPMNSRIPLSKIFTYFKFNPKNFKKALNLTNYLYADFVKTKNNDQNEIEEFIESELKYQLENRNFFVKLKKSMYSLKNKKNCKVNEQKINVPTLVIVGKYDRVIPAKSGFKAYSKGRNKNKEFIRIDQFNNSGHLPFIEEEQEYAKRIIDYFATIKNN